MAELRTHKFHLRHNLNVFLELPVDLTPDEAARLGMFLSSLPFGETEDNRGNVVEKPVKMQCGMCGMVGPIAKFHFVRPVLMECGKCGRKEQRDEIGPCSPTCRGFMAPV